MDNFNLKKYLAEGKLLTENYNKESLLKALGDADDAMVQLSDGREFVIYNPNSNNQDNADMWHDDVVFGVNKDGDEQEIEYSDISGINLEESKSLNEDRFIVMYRRKDSEALKKKGFDPEYPAFAPEAVKKGGWNKGKEFMVSYGDYETPRDRAKAHAEKNTKEDGETFEYGVHLQRDNTRFEENLNEITNYGGEGTYPMSEKPGDMFQQKEVEELLPIAMASRDDKAFQDRLKKHAEWTEQSGYNNTFVHFQYHETKDLEDDYFIHQKQHYNHNYDDFRSPRFTELYIVKNNDTDKEEELGTYIVSTPEFMKDIKALDIRDKLGKRVSENLDTQATKIKIIWENPLRKLKGDNAKDLKAIDSLEENRAKDLASDYSLEELNDFLQQLYGEMEQEAEPEGGPIADQYADEIYQYEEAIRIKKGVGQRGRKDITYDQAIGREDITDETGTYTLRPDGTKDYKRITPMTRDEFEKSSKFDRNLKENFNLKKYLAEGKLLKEFVGGELEKRNNVLYDELVPGMGKADTKEGEMLRAINRIVYRYYNDGDKYFEGYGTETAGPAHSFLVNANTGVRSAMEKIFGDGTNYEETIEDALEHIVSHIEAKQGKYTPNTEDMFSYEAEFEDEEDYDSWDDDYYDEEDEYYEK